MASIHSLVDRSKALQTKYDKYLQTDKPKKEKDRKDSEFEVELDGIAERAEELEDEASKVPAMKDRAKVALANAEIRKKKAAVLADISHARALAIKGKVTKEAVATRQQQVNDLEERVCNVPDGMNIARKKPGAASPKKGMFGLAGNTGKATEVHLSMSSISGNPTFYEETEENRAFQQEYENRKVKQDAQLDIIEKGLGNLQNIAVDMGAEMQKQDLLLDDIETQMDKATNAVSTNNAKLAGVLKKVRSTRNFCMDIILIIVLLAVLGYIYSLIK